MSNSKNYNSIVFLTTLSVYLGLVLVGAPPILAQAALARQFDIQNEIEVKDDLDKKPDDETCTELKAKTYEQDIQFVKAYLETVSQFLKPISFAKSKDYDLIISVKTDSIDDDEIFNRNFSALRKELSLGSFEQKIDDGGFFEKLNLKSKFQNKDISSFVQFYNASLEYLHCETQYKSANLILTNTKITYENNQVFIVTRLPRGSLDALLARKDA